MAKLKSACLGAVVAGSVMLCVVSTASAMVVFDNGPVDQNRVTWNDTDPSFTIYDDFTLSSNTTISGIRHSIFKLNSATYVQTFVSIFDGVSLTAAAVIPEFSAVGTLTPNGLTTTNTNVPDGFDVAIDGLSINLGPGSYFLGIRTDLSGTNLVSIGSGPGSGQTIGPGLFQASGTSPASGGDTRTGDHMAFQILSTQVPEPGALSLLGLGLVGLGLARRRKAS